MFVAVLQAEIAIPGAHSLKDKRHVVKSLVARMRNEHAVSAAEIADLDVWTRATIGAAFVSNDARHAESHMRGVLNALERGREFSVVDSRIEVF